ncbi:hypothetical protein HYW21_04700 [Candidatus Woesearchaeota archaeon]|nr:hypothetical protein [Candidatus Woesearchaeota archaeon]
MTTNETDFQEKWKAVLQRILSHSAYTMHVNKHGWDNLSTSALPGEAQQDIDRHKRSITADAVLVINHAYAGHILIDGSRESPHGEDERTYFRNLERLLTERDPQKIQTVIFDFPELYVHDSRQRLVKGDIESVVLTPFNGGGSLSKGQAYREIGVCRTVFLAGSYLPCLKTTAEELWIGQHHITMIEDASLKEPRRLVSRERDKVLERMKFVGEIPLLSGFTTTEAFLQQYGREKSVNPDY